LKVENVVNTESEGSVEFVLNSA